MCMDMCIDMCIDKCIAMCIDMCTPMTVLMSWRGTRSAAVPKSISGRSAAGCRCLRLIARFASAVPSVVACRMYCVALRCVALRCVALCAWRGVACVHAHVRECARACVALDSATASCGVIFLRIT